MAVFRFGLEKVLTHRRHLVDLRAQELAAVQKRLAELAGRIKALVREQARCRAAELPLRADALAGRAGWLAELDRRGERLAAEHTEVRAELEAARDRLQAAWRDREVLAQLRARQEGQWRQEQARRERAELDEIGQQRSAAGAGHTLAG